MREHMGLYRGKRVDSGAWVEGYLSKRPSAIQIGAYCPWYIYVPPLDPDDNGGYYNVDPDTVGECTGLTDKNGKLIFEGDIVRHHNDNPYVIQDEGKVYWDKNYCGWRRTSNGAFHHGVVDTYRMSCNCVYEIIGNIHDNPQLLLQEE